MMKRLVALLLALPALGFDEPPAHPAPNDAGRVQAASPEPERAKAEMRIPKGMKVDLYAAEPLVANPVAFHFDEKGRLFVIETFRHTDAVTDNRSHMNWLDADLASRTVEDRVAMYRKFMPADFKQFSATEDRVRLVLDKDGDGKADSAQVFADGFSDPADGIAAGVLARKGDVYLASIPSLWLLKDTKGTGKADVRKELQRGYGVHVAFLGHDLHGLRFGPDGRLYFSIGDRGLNVKTADGKVVACPDTGAVLRCEPDGSNLEIFASGLRNPQELAFDDLGNLFTVDNNSDSGDKARVVHLAEGGDSGWRIGYQYIEEPNNRGPWNAEKLWYPRWNGQAAYILPPLMNLSDGPSGFTHEPGVSLLPDKFRGHFFLADFRGAHGQSGIRSFALEPNGASFNVTKPDQPIWSVLATDVDFGPDGGLYVSDWVDGWNKTGKGRVWKFSDPSKAGDPRVAEVKRLLGEGMTGRPVPELTNLLAHADQRVRQEAQFELADRAFAEVRDSIGIVPPRNQPKPSPVEALRDLAAKPDAPQIARVHAVWALGQVGRQLSAGNESLVALLEANDPEVRAQAAKVIGEIAATGRKISGGVNPIGILVKGLKDTQPRVRFFFAQALGKLGDKGAVPALLDLLQANNDGDLYIRHAAVVALAQFGDADGMTASIKTRSRPVRLGVLLALRRMESPAVATFLADPEPDLVREAARAISDVPISQALPELAKVPLTEKTKGDAPLLRRVIAANERVGGQAGAKALLAIGLDRSISEAIREEAFDALATWTESHLRDRLTGVSRPIDGKPASDALAVLAPAVPDLLKLNPGSVRGAAVEALAGVGVKEAGPALKGLATSKGELGSIRVRALKALDRLGDPGLAEAVTLGVDDGDSQVRSESHRLLARLQPETAMPTLEKVWTSGNVKERQNVAEILGGMNLPAADRLIASGLDALASGKLPAELELDVREAAAKRSANPEIRDRLARVAPSGDDPIAAFKACLTGGDMNRGGKLFRQNTAVECLRCHKVKGEGGEVGPDLTGLGQKQSRLYLLESIVTPNKAIAQGFESVVVALDNGTIVTGVFRGEDEKELRLVQADGKAVTVKKSEIEERRRGPSAMPEDIVKKLSKQDIRDLVEFLSRVR